jgi:hypothetical protein
VLAVFCLGGVLCRWRTTGSTWLAPAVVFPSLVCGRPTSISRAGPLLFSRMRLTFARLLVCSLARLGLRNCVCLLSCTSRFGVDRIDRNRRRCDRVAVVVTVSPASRLHHLTTAPLTTSRHHHLTTSSAHHRLAPVQSASQAGESPSHFFAISLSLGSLFIRPVTVLLHPHVGLTTIAITITITHHSSIFCTAFRDVPLRPPSARPAPV